MNRIEIKSSGDVEVTLNGVHIGSMGIDYAKPDRITIVLTEREAVCVRDAVAKVGGSCRTTFRGHADKISAALGSVGIRILDYGDPHKPLEGKVVAVSGVVNGNVGAERVPCLHTSDQVRLTMDRDVAVTLKHLLDCLECTRELDIVWVRLTQAGAILHPDDPPRFTGTIRWCKKKLEPFQCEVGKVYRRCLNDKWEPVE